MPPHDLHSDPLAPAAAGDSERPLFLDVEMECICEQQSGRYGLTEELRNDAPDWWRQRDSMHMEYSYLIEDGAKLMRRMLSEATDELFCAFTAAEGCSASTPPQSAGDWVTWVAAVRISVPDLGAPPPAGRAAAAPLESELGKKWRATEAAQLTAKLEEAQADAERQRAAAQKAAEQLKAERAAAADLKKALGRERGAKETAEAALADSRHEAARLTAERDAARAAADDAAEKLGGERAAKEAAQSALAAARREAAQLKAERDAERAAAEQAAEKLAKARSAAEQVPEMVKQLIMKQFAAAGLPPSCSAVERFYDRYADSLAATTPAQVDALNMAFLVQCAQIPGAGPESEFVAMHAMLKRNVDARIAAHKAKGEGFGRMSEAEARMALTWSTGSEGCATYKGQPLKYCGWINLALDYKGSDGPLQRVLPVVRTLNNFCVTAPRDGDGGAAPAGGRSAGEEMEAMWTAIGRKDWKLSRGGGMSIEHKDWFVPGLVYRQPHYVATSLERDTVQDFAEREGAKPGCIPVIWEVLIHEERRCCHVNYLGTRFSFYDEAELLFPPFSVFTVRAVDWAEPGSGRISRITIEAASDNKEYPLSLPEAPWS